MTYLTYEEYVQIGGGSTLDLSTFNRNIDRACGIIDNATFHRIDNMDSVPRQAKACCRDLVEYLSSHTVLTKAINSKSQSVGGVSESESYLSKSPDEMYLDMQNILYDYLEAQQDDKGTPLLYRGCMR